jgi:hypothetical protein
METNNNELTPQRSLQLINETLESNRRSIIAGSGSFFILWGVLLAVFSLAVYFGWSRSGHPAWNILWFAMPVVGYPLAFLLDRRSKDKAPQNFISSLLGRIWGTFGFFSISISALAIAAFPMNISLVIIVLFGCAETISGIALKNWPIIIAGAIVGLGGACAAVRLASGPEQMLLFTGAAVVLALTGVALKIRK